MCSQVLPHPHWSLPDSPQTLDCNSSSSNRDYSVSHRIIQARDDTYYEMKRKAYKTISIADQKGILILISKKSYHEILTLQLTFFNKFIA